MQFELSPEARAEFEEGERHYEQQVPGLGARFRSDVRESLARLRSWPLAAPIERGDIRRLVLTRFPYKLLYSVESDRVYSVAAAHLHRRPNYRIERGDK